MRLLATLASLAIVSASAAPAHATWGRTPVGAPLCTVFGDQHRPCAIPDGAGGAFMVFVDLRNGGSYDLYAQRVDLAGTPLWGGPGVPVCTATGLQELPQLVSDGAGGLIVAWEDSRLSGNFDIYAQRLNASGVALWTANGVTVCGASGDQVNPAIVADGAGGAIVAWTDFRAGGTSDVWAQRINASGAPQWAANGVALCTAANDQDSPVIAGDGAGGALVAWTDLRNNATYGVYARRITGAGVPQWAANGVALGAAAGDQLSPVIASDDAGGAIVTWADDRAGGFDIYAQRVNASGAMQWGAGADSVCAYPTDQQYPAIVGDGAGGAFIVWEDARAVVDDLWAQHLDASGARTWPANGVLVCGATGLQSEARIVRDDGAGVLVCWQDARTGSYDVYAQHLAANGSGMWPFGGVALCSASGQQVYPALVSDGSGGAIAIWEDNRSLENDIYGQRVLGGGVLGVSEPLITSMTDVPDDDGGRLTVSWNAAWFDSPPSGLATSYQLWRRLANGTWQAVDTVTASGQASYSVVAPANADSIVGVPTPYTTYRVDALGDGGTPVWSSPPDSAFSSDNSRPAAPANLLALRSGNVATLRWSRNHEPDVGGYRIFYGEFSYFDANQYSLHGTRPDTTWTGVVPMGYWVKVTALDIHGNESDPSAAQPESNVGVDPGVPPAAFFAAPSPNPANGPCVFRFGLARSQRVQFDVYDERGRRVRRFDSGELPPGQHTLLWDGHDASNHDAGPGVYFVRTRLEGRELTQRVVRFR